MVFKNDNGYTYGYIKDRDIDSEYVKPEEEEKENAVDRDDMEYDIYNAVRKNDDKPIKLVAVWDDESKREFRLVGYNDSREFGVAAVSEEDDSEFIPIEELSDSEVEDIWNAITF